MSGRIKLDDAGPPERPPQEPERERTPPPPPPANLPEPPPLAADDGAPPESTPAQVPDEAQKRIDRLTWEKYENARRAEAAERALEAERQERQRQARSTGYGPTGQDDAERRGYDRAQQELAAKRFNEACDGLYSKGVGEFGEDSMSEAVRRLNAVGWGVRPDALEAVTQLPNGHAVYRALADDMDNAHRLLTLPPMALAVELARLSHGQNGVANAPPMPGEAPAPRVSRAPAPLRTLSANSQRPEKPLNDPSISMSEYIRRRERDAPGPSARIRRT